MITWNYLPKQEEYQQYENCIKNNYDDSHQQLLNSIYKLQTMTFEKQNIIQECNNDNNSWRNSSSYKIGRVITYLPRKIRSIFFDREP